MKTYILSQLSKLKKVSSSLDEKTEVEKILCGKPWHIFNDGDVCETYLFEPNGKLRIILGGKVTNAQWEYVEALKCVQLSLKDQQYMLQLSFFDQTLLAMKLYSGNEYCIMIEESRYADSQLKTLNDVQQYFATIAAKQEKQLQEQKQLEEKRLLEQKRKEEESEKGKKHQIELNRIKEDISSAWLNSDECKKFREQHKWSLVTGLVVLSFFIIISINAVLIFVLAYIIKKYLGDDWVLLLTILSVLFIFEFVYFFTSWNNRPYALDESYKVTYTQFVEEYLRTFKYSLTSTEVESIIKYRPNLTK